MANHEEFMEQALEVARIAETHGDVPVGAIIVKDGVVIGKSEPRVMVDNDPTAHAELLAIRNASIAIGAPYLAGCTMYVTFECCPMCCGAIMNSGIDSLIIGGRFEEPRRTYGSYDVSQLLTTAGADKRINFLDGVLKRKCETLFTFDKRDDWLERMKGDNPGWGQK